MKTFQGQNRASQEKAHLSYMLKDAASTLKPLKSAVNAAEPTKTEKHDSVSPEEVQKMITSALQSFYHQMEESITSIVELTVADALKKVVVNAKMLETMDLFWRLSRTSLKASSQNIARRAASKTLCKVQRFSRWWPSRWYRAKHWQDQSQGSWKVKSAKLSRVSPSRDHRMTVIGRLRRPLAPQAMPREKTAPWMTLHRIGDKKGIFARKTGPNDDSCERVREGRLDVTPMLMSHNQVQNVVRQNRQHIEKWAGSRRQSHPSS